MGTLYDIYAGLSGGFGGAELIEEQVEFDSLEAAEEYAYQEAKDIYDSYDGLHGLMTVEEIMEEEDLSEDEAYEAWEEQREDWIEYYVKESEI